jgi:exopolyphosphatase
MQQHQPAFFRLSITAVLHLLLLACSFFQFGLSPSPPFAISAHMDSVEFLDSLTPLVAPLLSVFQPYTVQQHPIEPNPAQDETLTSIVRLLKGNTQIFGHSRSNYYYYSRPLPTMEQLNDFLVRSKAQALNYLHTPDKQFYVVMGNEASDLDSMVSSIMFAFFKSLNSGENEVYVPVINIPRIDFPLRTETSWLFAKVGLSLDNLLFIDEINLEALLERKQLRLILTDHNKLARHQAQYADVITEIIDHHRNENLYNPTRRIIEPVGSATTLIAEEILDSPHKDILQNSQLAELLLSPILLDTAGFSESAGRFNNKDVRIFQRLLEICPLDKDALFSRLEAEKFNVSSLGSWDLLRKDYKDWKVENALGRRGRSLLLGISSVGQSVNSWRAKESDFLGALHKWYTSEKLDVLLVMTSSFDESKKFIRELVVYIEEARDEELGHVFDRLVAFLQNCEELKIRPLALDRPDTEEEKRGRKVMYFLQGNLKASRKVLQPILMEKFFEAAL